MTTTASVRPDAEQAIRPRVADLIEAVKAGRLANSILEFYAEDVSMQENLAKPVIGRQANFQRERDFEQSVARWNEVQAKAVLVDGDQAVIHWVMDYAGKDGKRYRLDQLSLQRWENGVIAEERFVYDPSTVGVG